MGRAALEAAANWLVLRVMFKDSLAHDEGLPIVTLLKVKYGTVCVFTPQCFQHPILQISRLSLLQPQQSMLDNLTYDP